MCPSPAGDSDRAWRGYSSAQKLIRKGGIDRPVEFGYKAQVLDNNDGIILDYSLQPGAAGVETGLHEPGVSRSTRLGRRTSKGSPG